jgi:hypothetical protein
MWETFTTTWRNRLLAFVLVTGVGYPFAMLLRLGPEPVPWVTAMAVVMSLLWLVFDVLDEDPTQWVPTLATPSDHVDAATNDLRILTSHQQASVPSDAVRERLVALAGGRDPDLADALRHELAAAARIAPAQIDRILTRIEESRG